LRRHKPISASKFISVEGRFALEVKAEYSVTDQTGVDDRHIVRTLPILIVHAHSSCNCRCVMCDIWKNRENKIFRARDLELQLDSIRRLRVRWIVFSGGEPLMNPELPEMCAVLRKEGIRLTLLSTGLLLKKYATPVANGFDDVIVSLDGPPEIHNRIRRVSEAFQVLHVGIRALRAVRPDIRITARSTIQKANHSHLKETARTAKSLQLNEISFLAVDVTSTAFNRSLVLPISCQDEIGLALGDLPALEEGIELLIRDGGKEFGPGFIAESPKKLRRIVHHFRAQLGLETRESPFCNAPWVSAVVEADGAVRPCFFHPAIGNLQSQNLETVLNGGRGLRFRQNLDIPTDSVCRNCVCSLNYRA
jgi:Fe-coproporphyrin III synthase